MFREINESSLLVKLEGITKEWVESLYVPDGFYLEFAELLLEFVEVYVAGYSYFGFIKSWCEFVDEHNVGRFNLTSLVKYLEGNTFCHYKKFFSGYKSVHLCQLRRHRANEVRNRRSLMRALKDAVNVYYKSEVIRIDLAYKQSENCKVDILKFYNNFTCLRDEISKQESPFHDLVDYFWALEQGETKGYHCHLLLIFNGNKRQRGWSIARDIGKLWERITNGQGCYFNCHDPVQIEKYRKLGILGIGRIHRDNKEEVELMLNAAMYLVSSEKESQHLRVKINPKMRTFQ